MIDEARLYPIVGERVRKLRTDPQLPGSRMTQAELAALVQLERTSITNIEKGTQKVPLHVLYRICEVLGASITAVLPALSEVQNVDVDRSVAEVELGGRTYQTTPLVKQKIAALLNLEATSDPTHQ